MVWSFPKFVCEVKGLTEMELNDKEPCLCHGDALGIKPDHHRISEASMQDQCPDTIFLIGQYWGLYWDNGKENRNYYSIIG